MFLTHLRIALASLRSTSVRTTLTTLGIVIGVASITLVLSLGEGAKQAVNKHVQELDNNVIVVRPGKVTRDSFGSISKYSPLSSYAASTLTEADLTTVQNMKSVQAVAPIMLINGSIKEKNTTAEDAAIIATTPGLAQVLHLEASQGQFLDGTTASDTVVIGQQLSVDMFGTDQSIGRQIKIRGQDFTVIGVLKKVQNPLGINGINLDHAAIVSLDSGKSFNQGIAQIQQMNIQPKDKTHLRAVASEISKNILKNHDNEEDFAVLSGKDASDISSDFFSIIVGMTTAVASISLLVGGIGIMNIMLVSVAERTREVGIRKSLGASNHHIMVQFLIESLLMSIIGGIVGFALAYAIGFLLSTQLAFQPVLSWYIFFVAFGLSSLVGVVFGVFPAVRAAKKDPIIALRQYH